MPAQFHAGSDLAWNILPVIYRIVTYPVAARPAVPQQSLMSLASITLKDESILSSWSEAKDIRAGLILS
jgi:hypothetical protein